MLVPWDLGFPGLICFCLFFCPFIGFVIRRKWRIAEARKMEILRLVAMASEEAKRAEIEAAFEYGTVSITPQYQCALCYAPTTTRCSRCKSVRYCSGKCQIIHWRQGHKEECHPPNPIIQLNGPESDSDRKTVLEGEKHESFDTGSRETFPEEPASSESGQLPEFRSTKNDDESGSLEDDKGEDAISDSSCRLAGIAKSATTYGSNDVSVSSISVSSSPDSLNGASLDGSGFDGLEKNVDVNDTKLTRPPPVKYNGLDTSVNGFSRPDNLKQKTASSSAEEVYCELTSSQGSSFNKSEMFKSQSDFLVGGLDLDESGNDVHDDSSNLTFSKCGYDTLSNSGNHSLFPSDLSQHAFPSSGSESKTFASDVAHPVVLDNRTPANGASLSGKRAPAASVVRYSPTFSSARSTSVTSSSNNSSELSKPIGNRSLLPKDSHEHPSSASGEHQISNDKPSKAEKVQVVATRLRDVAISPQDVSNGLKMSVQKAVQQFKVPKLSRHYALGFGSDVAGKHNYKMLFPYEVFVKLYNKDKAELQPCGLTNLGNSCYANAVLQCLAFTRPLTAYLLQGLHSKACQKKEWCFTCEFETLIQKAKEGKSPLSPVGILSQLQNIGGHLGHGKEEDAHEFLRYSIDKLQSVCLKEAGINAVGPLAEETTLIGLIFGGYLRSKIKCMKCHGKSECHERMMDLTVEIQGDIGTLEEALGQFTATEILDGENKYHCSRCKSYEKAKKKLTVLEAPNVLTIALKRFQSGKFGKLNKAVRFPEVLNLAPYMSGTSDKSPIYSLYAVVVHLDIMNAAFSGHYVCYVKNSQGKWFKIDDSTVKPVELERVLSKGAYMLLYARCSARAPGLIRNAILSNESKMKRWEYSELTGKSSTVPKAKLTSVASMPASATTQNSHEEYPYWINVDRSTSFETFDSLDRRFHSVHRIRKVDSSSSDSCSLLSCSDEGSCSTESTRDSTSADEVSPDYIYGEMGRGWNSPLRASDDSYSSSPSPSYMVSDRHGLGYHETSGYPIYSGGAGGDESARRKVNNGGVGSEGLRDKGCSRPFLYSDITNHCTKLNSNTSSSSRETDSERKGWGNSFDVKSGASLMRRSTKERTKPFY